ncbi:MAG: hypothetical protein GY870_17825 [archaeon]|nr:hypothetical protein [archaeon]
MKKIKSEFAEKETFKICFPRMGWSYIAFKALFREVPGFELIDPPKVNKSIVELGLKHSPEFVCFPFKVVMGEMLYWAEHFKLNHFAMVVDCAPCRMGYYAPVQERILRDLGYNATLLPWMGEGKSWIDYYDDLAEVSGVRLGKMEIYKRGVAFVTKAKYIEDITNYEGIIRCREIHKGDTTKTVNRLMKLLDKEDHLWNLLFKFPSIIKKEFKKIPIRRGPDVKPLRVMMTGEIHVLLEHYDNNDLLKKLGERGVEVHPCYDLYDYITFKLGMNSRRKRTLMVANEYMPIEIGGEAPWNIGSYLECQRDGFDGFIEIYPFTCLPEISFRSVIEGQQSIGKFYLPIQYYIVDEHTAFEGLRTRLETFIYLMETNRENNPKFKDKYKEPEALAEIYDKPIKSSIPKTILEKISNYVQNKVFLSQMAEMYNIKEK